MTVYYQKWARANQYEEFGTENARDMDSSPLKRTFIKAVLHWPWATSQDDKRSIGRKFFDR
jgi:hypothetical protein